MRLRARQLFALFVLFVLFVRLVGARVCGVPVA
jgi:hypothetical protein